MAYVVATNITSPLGMTTEENYTAVKDGRSMLRRYDGLWGLPEPFCASLFTDEQRQALAIDGLTRFESLAIRSATAALHQTGLDVAAKNIIFILSTTKGNVELLSTPHLPPPTSHPSPLPGVTALRIARHLGFTTTPVVVCNACISGVAAIILAQRLLDGGQYDYAVVCGADVQCPFTVAGFQSLKAVSADPCRPFDMERTGLNLGEAAATMVLARSEREAMEGDVAYRIAAGTIRNDAFHISSPSKNGEGAWLALRDCLASCLLSPEELAFINAHGTATMFNDQMESVAIERAGLASVPVNGLKGYYGHTLGAAGVLETVLSLAALRDHTVLATRGFTERGVSGKIGVTTENITTTATSFVKMISGFGGGNAALVCRGERCEVRGERCEVRGERCEVSSPSPLTPHPFSHRVILTPSRVTLDGQTVSPEAPAVPVVPVSPVVPVAPVAPVAPAVPENPVAPVAPVSPAVPEAPVAPSSPEDLTLTALYKRFVGDYPKFYKMDGLSRLGFLASELLTSHPSPLTTHPSIVLFNSSSSIAADRKFQATLSPADFFPSPSIFVYTLPNIVTGEVALRHGSHGETSFFVLPCRDEALMRQIVLSTLSDPHVSSIITGWLDYYDESNYEADLTLFDVASFA